MDTQRKTAMLAGNGGINENTELTPVYPVSPELSTTGNDGAKLPDRFRAASEFENRVLTWLCNCDHIQAIAKTGFEHTLPDPKFREILRRVASPEVAKWRFRPDFLAVSKTDKLTYIECKKSMHVERDAFQYYMRLDECVPVWIILETADKQYWQQASVIRFLDSNEYVSQFSDPFAVDSDGWILPRPGPGHSSCPFRVVDMASLIPLDLGGVE